MPVLSFLCGQAEIYPERSMDNISVTLPHKPPYSTEVFVRLDHYDCLREMEKRQLIIFMEWRNAQVCCITRRPQIPVNLKHRVISCSPVNLKVNWDLWLVYSPRMQVDTVSLAEKVW